MRGTEREPKAVCVRVIPVVTEESLVHVPFPWAQRPVWLRGLTSGCCGAGAGCGSAAGSRPTREGRAGWFPLREGTGEEGQTGC